MVETVQTTYIMQQYCKISNQAVNAAPIKSCSAKWNHFRSEADLIQQADQTVDDNHSSDAKAIKWHKVFQELMRSVNHDLCV